MLRRIKDDFHGVMASSQRMRNNLSIGEQLLCRAKEKHTPERDLKDKLGSLRDCIVLECGRDKNMRAAHGSVLEISSPKFIERLVGHSVKISGGLPVVELDLSVNVLDLMLQYFYTNKTIEIPSNCAIQLLGAARKTIPAPALVSQLESYLIDNIKSCLKDPNFIDGQTDHATDVLSLSPVIEKMHLDRKTIITFVQRLTQWSTADRKNRAVGLALIEKLTNIQNEQAALSIRNAIRSTRRFFLAIAIIVCMFILRSSVILLKGS